MTTTTTTSEATEVGNVYLRLWRNVPRELGFHVLTLPVAVIGFGITIGLFSAGIGTLVTFFIGVILLIVALYVSQGFGMLELIRLEWAGMKAIERPDWQVYRARTGFWGWLRSVLGNGHYWLYLLHTMVVNFIVSTITWSIVVTWVTTALGGISYWFWSLFIPRGDQDWFLSNWFLDVIHRNQRGLDYTLLDGIAYFVTGLGFLATLPFVTRGLALLHHYIAAGMLGAFKSDALRKQVGTLTAARGAASSAEGHSLRRLERDIHDGPQQRLVRLQMDLAAAERQLETDPKKAKTLITEAMAQSKEALEELRALSRGFAPPLLLDRGLVAAVESAADRSPVPVKIENELGTVELPQELERNAYFVVSEALANVAKHSGATESTIRLWVADSALTIAVYDNGSGGAELTEAHGLAGLQERLLGLGGTLEVHSPAGGPTTVIANLPLPASA